MTYSIRVKAIAHQALHKKVHPRRLRKFTDTQWANLGAAAEAPDPTMGERTQAVNYLTVLYNEREYHQ